MMKGSTNLSITTITLFLFGSTRAGSVRRRLSEDNNNNNNIRRSLWIENDEVSLYQSRFNNREPLFKEIDFSSYKNEISFDGRIYSLNSLEELSLFSKNFTIFRDGKEVNYIESPVEGKLYFGKDGDSEIFVSDDEERRINVIEIFDGENITTLVSNLTLDFNSTEAPPYKDIDDEDDEDQETMSTNVFFKNMPSFCSSYRTIEVAIAFDTSYCYWVGGYNQAVSRVHQTVALADKKYRQAGLCLALKLTHIDGHCDYNTDPYKSMRYWLSGCGGTQGYLNDFQNYWKVYMNHIHRDSAHLFTANNLDGPIGCSGIGCLCKIAYGVEEMSYFKYDINLEGNLFAHELAHNCGANHVGGHGYVMNPNINYGQYGFSSQSVWQMISYLNSVSCLSY